MVAPVAPIISSTSSKGAANVDDNRDPKRKKLGIDYPKSKRLDPALQCASYALELLAHGGLRSHVIGVLVTDNWMKLIFYDRSLRIIVSKPFDFLAESLKFIQVLDSFCRFNMQQWGFSDVIDSDCVQPKQECINVELKLNGPESRVLKLGRIVYGRHSLIGRGAIVVEAQRDGGEGLWADDLVVKFSWPTKTRASEEAIIRQAREYAKATKDLDRLTHLPNILHAEDKERSLFYEAFMTSLGIPVQEKLSPITDHHNAPSLAKPFKDIFYCKRRIPGLLTNAKLAAGYRWLVEEVKTLHRDISPSNLMMRCRGTSVYGVLNDFDLAVAVDQQDSPSKHRIGTKPFMAIELLHSRPIKHLYRHDLESLYYALLWIALRFKAGKEIRGGPLQTWTNCSTEQLFKEKQSFITVGEILPVVGEYAALESWLFVMFATIGHAREAQREANVSLRFSHLQPSETIVPLDAETLGGIISFDSFRNIFEIPFQ